jgi:hypothetical protein
MDPSGTGEISTPLGDITNNINEGSIEHFYTTQQ